MEQGGAERDEEEAAAGGGGRRGGLGTTGGDSSRTNVVGFVKSLVCVFTTSPKTSSNVKRTVGKRYG